MKTLPEGRIMTILKKAPVSHSATLADKETLQKEAAKRAKQRSLWQKITQVFRREQKDFCELIINVEPMEKRVAFLVNGLLERFEVEYADEEHWVGAIFKGRVQNLENGLQAAFIDIGQEKNAFLHYWDMLPSFQDAGVEIFESKGHKPQENGKSLLKNIPLQFPIGKEIVVQVTKEQIGNKGPRVTTNISLAGRYLVLTPYTSQLGVSRRIENSKERERLKGLLSKMTIPEGMGLIFRTASQGQKLRYFVRDLHLLLKQWRKVEEKIQTQSGPVLLYKEPSLLERSVRDFLTEDVDRVLTNDPGNYQEILRILENISPRSKGLVKLFSESIPIFERFGIERQIDQLFMRRLSLPSGGEIVIEESEALTAIDINTGSHRSESRNAKDYIFQVNCEAVKEIARHIRLRNIAGLIVVDFVDMTNPRHRRQIWEMMSEEMEKDKMKSHVYPLSQVGLMQISRQRHTESMFSSLYESCPYCSGHGKVRSAKSVGVNLLRKLNSLLHREKEHQEKVREGIKVFLNPEVYNCLCFNDRSILKDLEHRFSIKLHFQTDVNFHIENYKFVDLKTGKELNIG